MLSVDPINSEEQSHNILSVKIIKQSCNLSILRGWERIE